MGERARRGGEVRGAGKGGGRREEIGTRQEIVCHRRGRDDCYN